jgi:hypothetical protein
MDDVGGGSFIVMLSLTEMNQRKFSADINHFAKYVNLKRQLSTNKEFSAYPNIIQQRSRSLDN